MNAAPNWRNPRSLSSQLVVFPRKGKPREFGTVTVGALEVEGTEAERALRDYRAATYLASRGK